MSDRGKGKKSFKDNPALQFVTRVEVKGEEGVKETKGESREKENRGFEAKSKRFNMLMRPSVFEKLKSMAGTKGTSINDLMNTVIEAYIDNNDKK